MKISLILPCFRRAHLLDLGLSSIVERGTQYELEIVVVNDGLEDGTKEVCDKYKQYFDMKYIFSGQRNIYGIKSRVPGFAINIGVKQSTSDVIILSCPEVYHLNNCIDLIVTAVLGQDEYITIPESMYFDDVGDVTSYLLNSKNTQLEAINAISSLTSGIVGVDAVTMPYLMAMYKFRFMEIGGYDEDFIGYAGDDNDLMHRLLMSNGKDKGLKYGKLPAKIIHLYHGERCDAQMHPENPKWVYNYKLFNDRKNQRIRNIGKEWGKL